MNRPEPEICSDVVTDGVLDLDVYTSYITKEEIVLSLRDLKNNKATGIDNMLQKLFKLILTPQLVRWRSYSGRYGTQKKFLTSGSKVSL